MLDQMANAMMMCAHGFKQKAMACVMEMFQRLH